MQGGTLTDRVGPSCPAASGYLLSRGRDGQGGVREGYRRRLEPITGPLLKTMRLVENFLRPLTILEFTSSDALSYANLRAKLERAGKPIGPFDTLIAAQALGQKLILVSNNEREFGRVSGLRLENWARV